MKDCQIIDEQSVPVLKIISYPFDGNFHLFKTNFHRVQNKSGLYVLEFCNGKRYVGETGKLVQRLNQHYKEIWQGTKGDWHSEVNKMILQKCNEYGATFRYEFLRCTKLYIQYTDTKEQAQILEKKAFKEICKNDTKGIYYNLKYF